MHSLKSTRLVNSWYKTSHIRFFIAPMLSCLLSHMQNITQNLSLDIWNLEIIRLYYKKIKKNRVSCKFDISHNYDWIQITRLHVIYLYNAILQIQVIEIASLYLIINGQYFKNRNVIKKILWTMRSHTESNYTCIYVL